MLYQLSQPSTLRQHFPNFIFAQSRKLTIKGKANKQTKKEDDLILCLNFWYWFGFVKMKKLLFLTPLLNFSHIALHPISKSEASLRGSHGGTFGYPLDRKASQQWVLYGQALTLQNCYFYYFFFF